MQSLLTSFIHALRNADIRISPAETLDAVRAAELVGSTDRTRLKNALALTLPKTPEEKVVFDACFEQFFASRSHSSPPEQTAAHATALDFSEGPVDSVTPASPLGQLLGRANPVEIGAAIHAAARQANVRQIQVFTQKGVYTRRTMEAMGLQAFQQEIAELESSQRIAERRLAQHLAQQRDWLRARIREHVEHQFLLHADVSGRRLREDLLRNARLSAIDRRHQHILEQIVQRMARRLVSAHSRRKRVARRGQLHVPRTVRNNLKYDDAIFDLHWRSEKVSQPNIFAICDVSGSVADYSRFMLMLLYSLAEVLPRVRSFAFSSDLGEVSGVFDQHRIEAAITRVLDDYGGGATDYGRAFSSLRSLCFEDVDRRTTVIILGDARNNHGDSRIDLLKELYGRCKRLIWLNPEPKSMWNTGDSDMRHFAVYCHDVAECGTVAQLERFVSRLLKTVR